MAQNIQKYGYDSGRIDNNVKPGDDFYLYACGKWISQLPDRPEYPIYDQFEIRKEDNARKIRQIIQEAALSEAPQGSIQQQIGDYYSIFMDSTRRNNEGATPLKPYLKMVENIRDRKDIMEIAAALYRHGVNNMFMAVSIQNDMQDAKQNIVCIKQGGLTLINRNYYTKDDSSTLKIRHAYHKYIENVFVLSGYSPKEAYQKMQDVNTIEHKIAEANFSKKELRIIANNYHRTRFDSLFVLYPKVDWNKFMQTLGFPEVSYINVAQPKAIENVIKIVSTEDLEKLKSYMEFKIIAAGAGSLSDDFVRENFLLNQALDGRKADKPRWKKAIDDINSHLGMGVGKLFSEKYFSEDSKTEVLSMINNIKEALRERISSTTWMGPETKAKALEKLDNMYIKIGYPDQWQDYSDLTINPKLPLYENSMNIKKYLFDLDTYRKLNKPVDRNEWLITPQSINAGYNPYTNEITFPAGILQAPFFDPNADDALNYGGIGCVMGHEMTHAFDDQGCLFDKEGNFQNWWTPEDKEEFTNRALVIEELFNQQEALPGEFADGKLTLGENIADNGGIKVAYMALEKHLAESPSSTNDGFTPQQRFYLNYAYIQAGNIKVEALRRQLHNDVHAPSIMRVNCQLPQIQSWYDVFNIPKKAPMAIPVKKRVDIW